MDKSHTILVHVMLHAQNFETYECNENRIIIGINIMHLFKIIHTCDTNDALSIYIDAADFDNGVVRALTFRFDNDVKKQCKITRLRLTDPGEFIDDYPNVTFSSVINMQSVEFQRIIRDLSVLSDRLEIKSIGSEVRFSCKGIFSNSEITCTESNDGLSFIEKNDPSKIIQGIFSLKSLGYFVKCTNLCQQIELYLENNLPLVVKYNVASLGSIQLCLASLPDVS